MIQYNPKEWLGFIFRFHKSDTFNKLWPSILVICLYSGAIAFLEANYWKWSESTKLQHIDVMHGLLGFVISLLLVFRTNTAYDRWWEGRKQWGALFNNSRNLAMKLHSMLPLSDSQSRSFFKTLIPQYAVALKNHLRSESTRLELDESLHPEINDIDHSKHIPNQLASLLFKKTNALFEAGKIRGEHLIILNNELQSFTDVCGACERIKNTPIPFSYSAFIKKFIFIYIFTLPFGYVMNLGYLIVPVVGFVFYVLTSLELIAEEIEDPFGSDTNDLPMDKICENIQKQIGDLM